MPNPKPATNTESTRSNKANAFLADIIAVYHKHGLALSHEDCHGAFLVVPTDETFVQWLLAAFDETTGT